MYELQEAMVTLVKEGLATEPNDPSLSHTLACLLGDIGRWDEAFDVAKITLDSARNQEAALARATEFLIMAAARGEGERVLKAIDDASAASALEPLKVGVELYLGKEISLAQEIQEVGKDVADQIRQASSSSPKK